MPYKLMDLVVDRVDLVDEGANSAAFIELYKRKEKEVPMDVSEILSKMKPEHAEVIQKSLEAKDEEIRVTKEKLSTTEEALSTAEQVAKDKDEQLNAVNDALAKANAELEVQKAAGETGTGEDDDEVIKAMPEAARAMFEKMRAQKEAAEEQVRKAAEEKAEAEAVAKAASLKALPVEQAKLVSILKSCSADVTELLTTINSAIEATVLGEIGKNKGNGADTGPEDAWTALEKKADEISKRDSITKEKAMSKAISECPDLYREYLNGGAK